MRYVVKIRELDFLNPKPFRVYETDDTSIEIDDIEDRITYEVVIEGPTGVLESQVHLGNGHGGDEPQPPPPKKKLKLILSWAERGERLVRVGARVVELIERIIEWTGG